MKSLTILALIIFTMMACKNNQNSEGKSEKTDKITLEVPAGKMLRYRLATGMSTEGGFTIASQAKNHTISKIKWNNDTKQLEYIYLPKEGFTGQDQVKIKEVISIGDTKNNTERVMDITIDVK